MATFDLPESQSVGDDLGLGMSGPTDNLTVQLDTREVWTSSEGVGWGNTQLGKGVWNTRDVRGNGGDGALVGKMVQQTTWRTIRRVDRT
ncbi:hypothetical protein WICPIJ_002685 [Wickerhamomyces pijperi]|uniref:Uncharacterized protein n=1 Tax=Wickerhamomyces pijperi TaxID=599730 RepID=A0A9P8Q933_WICPI|nr:hypothetical protein WICPIJ_002685 [Wickerhamomyces pijperi]